MINSLLRKHVSLARRNVVFFNDKIHHFSVRQQTQQPQLSPYDINLMLRENEYNHTFAETNSTILSYESNQLAANRPCEDARTEASFVHKDGFICGIFDGHAGQACAQVISKRLLRYIAAAVIDRKLLSEQIHQGYTSQSFLRCHNDKADFVKEIKDIYESSFSEFVSKLASQPLNSSVSQEIENAFVSLDDHLSEEALKHTNMLTMAVAMSGSVACVVNIDKLHLQVATTGDCAAVLGSQCPETGQWILKKLSNEHNFDNQKEVERILSEHPKEEHETIIRNERLLGQLAPLRALGDFRYKWSNDIMKRLVIPTFGEHVVPSNYHTPPYLTARPEVQQHVLQPNDKFLVLASDGLWDFMSPSQVVALVGEHINSKKILEPMKLPAGEVTLETVSQILAQRKAGRTKKPLDQNSATHLIRTALGGTDYGIELSKISYYLSLPQDVVRYYRDDITVTVIYFNSENVSKHIQSASSEKH